MARYPERIIKNIKRLNHILGTLVKYGFGYVIDKTRIEKVIKLRIFFKKARKDILHLSPGERIRKILEELGPTFIKFGQILSTRPDLIPVSFCKELEKLQDKAPSLPFNTIKKIIQDEMNEPVEKIFKSISSKALASASLAQIHEATLHSGSKVVIKVLKPQIEETIQSDLEILFYLARISELYLTKYLFADPVQIIREFRKSISREINFLEESKSIKKFTKYFSKDKNVTIPRLFDEYTTKKILVMEKLEGIKITDVDSLRKKKIDPKRIARISARSIFHQIFNYRSFHADPHPGNIIVLNQNKIAFIDFGLTGRLDESTKYILMKLLQALINKDMETLMIYLDKLIMLKDEVSKQEFQIELDEMISDYYDYSLADIDLQEIFEDVFKIMSKYKIKIPSNLFLLIKTLVTMEGIEKKLDPDFEIIKEITPFVKDFLMQEFSLATISKKIKRFAISFYDLVNILPARLDDISDKISQGRLKVKFEFTELNNLLDNLHRIVNRLVYSIITASVLLGSFFIIQTNIKPRLFGYPVLSLAGILFSFVMIVLMIIDIIRTRKH